MRRAPGTKKRVPRGPEARESGGGPGWGRIWPIAALFVLALILRLAGARAGLPEVFEEAYPFKRAWEMWGWDDGSGFDPNPHWFRYPGLVIYLQFAGQAVLYALLWVLGRIHSALEFRALYEMDKTAFYLMGRTITAVLGAATVVPVWHLARRAGGTAAAWCAGLLVAVNAVLVQKSWVVEVDVPMALLIALACVQALRLADDPTRRNALAGGLLVGLAAAAKYPGAIALIPVLVGLATGLRRAHEPDRAGETDATARRRAAATWPIALALVAGGAAAAFFVTSPFTILDYRSALADIGGERLHMALGHFGGEGGPSWGYYAVTWFAAMGWPAGIAALAGLAWFAFRRRDVWAIALGAPMVVYYATVGSWAMKADRYLIPLIPLGAVFAAALVARLLERRALLRVPRAAGWGAAIALLVMPPAADLAGRLRATYGETRGEARRWIEANIPHGAFIVTEFYAPELMCPGRLEEIPPDLIETIQKAGGMRPVYAAMYLPMYQVRPEGSGSFYDFRLLAEADYIVVTDPVRHRYRDDPALFPRQNAFYDTLETRWVRMKSFEGGPVGEIVIYRNPRHAAPFGARRDPPAVAPLLDPMTTVAEGAGYVYYFMGLNYEAYGHPRHAFDAYAQVLRFPPTHRRYRTRAALAAAQLLERSGRPDQAERFLSAAEARAADPGEREALARARAEVARRLPGR